MSNCKINSTTAGKAIEKLNFNVDPGFFHTEDFLKDFGNWTTTNFYNENLGVNNRVNRDGSPFLHLTGDKNNVFYINIKGVKQWVNNVPFKTLPSTKRAELSKDIVDTILTELALEFDRFSATTSEGLPILEKFYDELIEDLVEENRDAGYVGSDFNDMLAKSLKEDKQDYLDAILARLGGYGITYIEQEESTKEDGTEEVKTETQDGNLLDEISSGAVKQLASYLRTSEDKAANEIKAAFSFLTKHDKNGEVEYSKVFPGRTLSMSRKVVWKTLKEAFKGMPMIENADNVKIYMDRLKSLEAKYPWAEELHNILTTKTEKEERDLPLELAFVNSMRGNKNSIITTTKGKNGALKMQNTAESGSGHRAVISIWSRALSSKLFKREELNEGRAQEAERRVVEANKSLTELLKKVPKRATATDVENNLKAIRDILFEKDGPFRYFDIRIGLDVIKAHYYKEMEDNDAAKENKRSNSMALKAYIHTFMGFTSPGKSLFSNTDLKELKGAVNNNLLISIAKEVNRLDEFSATDSATVGKNKLYLHSLPTVIHQNINQLIQNPKIIEDLLKQPHLRNSLALKAWAADLRKLHNSVPALRGALQIEGQSAEGQDTKAIKKGDYTRVDNYGVLRMENGIHNPIYPTQIPADKGREYLLQMGIFEETANIKEAIPIFKGYLKDELGEMIVAKLKVDRAIEDALKDIADDRLLLELTAEEQTAVLEEASQSLTMGYTLTAKGKIGNVIDGKVVYEGPAFEFRLFPEMNNKEYTESALGFFVDGAPNVTTEIYEVTESLIDNLLAKIPNIDNIIEETLTTNVQVVRNFYEENDLGVRAEVGLLFDDKNAFDTATKTYYVDKYKTAENENKKENDDINAAIDAMYRDYAINSMISKIEFMKIHTGSLQHYKDDANYIKRVPGTYIDGIPLITGVTEGDTYFKQFTFSTETLNSELANAMKEWSGAYARVDRTDAQAWITPKRWLFLVERAAKGNKVQKPIIDKIKRQWASIKNGERVKAEDKLTSKEAKILSAQPVKGVYQKITLATGETVYNKYSQAVLIPQFVENLPKAKALLEYMEENDIDEAIAQTGVKVGARKANPLFVNDKFMPPNKNAIQTMDNRNWRWQQDLPTKEMHNNKVGTQIQKIIIEGLRFLGDTAITADGLTGTQLADQIDKSLMELSNAGIANFKNKYGIDENHQIKNLHVFYKSMVSDLTKEGKGTSQALEVLSKEYSPSSLPSMEKAIMSSFMSSLRKAGVNLLTSGGAYIQVSDHLIGIPDIEANSGIKMLVDNFTRLQPPKVEFDAKTQRNTVIPGQVFAPHSMIEKLIPNYEELDTSTLMEMLNEPGVLDLIGYRIPTQSRASTDILRIVGILPKEMGDSIIAYGEITAKTGSDFDIDKMFFMAPTLRAIKDAKTDEVSKVVLAGMSEETQLNQEPIDIEGFKRSQKRGIKVEKKSPETLQNNVFRAFSKALKSPVLYDAMMTTIDADTTEVMINAFAPTEVSYGLQVFNPVQAINTRFALKAGAAGIGEMVNAANDNIRQQGAGVTMSMGQGFWGNEEMDFESSEELKSWEIKAYLKKVNDYIKETGNKRPLFTASDVRSIKMKDVMSELTNAFVDIANKDAFITKANWGSVMNGYGTMLIRNGIHPAKVFRMFQQPIIKEMVTALSFKEGILDNEASYLIRMGLLNDAAIAYTKKADELNKKQPDKKKHHKLNFKVAYLSQINFNELLETNPDKDSIKYLKNQLIILQHFDQSVNQVRAYNGGVTSSKIGENGPGKSPGSVIAIENKINIAGYPLLSGQTNYINKFVNKEGEASLLLGFYKNQIEFWNKIVDSNPLLFFAQGKQIREAINQMGLEHDGKLMTSADKIDTVLNEVKKYVFSGFEPLNGSPVVAEQGDTPATLAAKFEEKENTRKENIDKLFALSNRYDILGKLDSDIINGREDLYMHRVGDLETPEKQGLISSWELLIQDHPALGAFLVQEAYAREGFAPGPRNFSELIPPMFLIEQGIEEHIKNNSFIDLQDFKAQFFRNPKVSKKVYTAAEELAFTETPGLAFRTLRKKESPKQYLQYQKRDEDGDEAVPYGWELHSVATFESESKTREGVVFKKKTKYAFYTLVEEVKNGSYYNVNHDHFLNQIRQPDYSELPIPSELRKGVTRIGQPVSASTIIKKYAAKNEVPSLGLSSILQEMKEKEDRRISQQGTAC